MKRFAHLTSLPKFTCKLETKFADMNLLCTPMIDSLDEDLVELLLAPKGMSAELIKPFVELVNYLEPNFMRIVTKPNLLVDCSYYQSIIRWKTIILFCYPELRGHVDTVELLYSKLLHTFIASLDRSGSYGNRMRQIVFDGTIYGELRTLAFLDIANQPAVTHVQAAVENRLVYHMGILLTQTGPEQDTSRFENDQETEQELITHDLITYNLSCPMQYLGSARAVESDWERTALGIQMEYQYTVLSRDKPECLFPWLIDCIPRPFWGVFGLDPFTLSHLAHKPMCQNVCDELQHFALTRFPTPHGPYGLPLEVTMGLKHATSVFYRLFLDCFVAEMTLRGILVDNFYYSVETGPRLNHAAVGFLSFVAVEAYLDFMRWRDANECALGVFTNDFEIWFNESGASSFWKEFFTEDSRNVILIDEDGTQSSGIGDPELEEQHEFEQ
jgi:hypothetical protein